jgi:hypothetical protein
MDGEAFKKRAKRLEEANSVIAKLDPAIRAAAFELLADYVTHDDRAPGAKRERDAKRGHSDSDAGDVETFFAQHEGNNKKPSDNAVLIAAYVYSQYGSEPFALSEIKSIADDAGITIPASIDMTFRQAKRDGNALFRHAGRSQYAPTVKGELYIKKTYSVSKGTKRHSDEGEA